MDPWCARHRSCSRPPGCRQGHPVRPPVAATTSCPTSPPATCCAPRSRRAPTSAARPRSHGRRRAGARRRDDRHRRRAPRPRRHHATAATSSTASPARWARPRRSTEITVEPPLDLVVDLDVRHRGRARAPRQPAGVQRLRRQLLGRHPAQVRLDLRQLRRRGRPARRRHPGGHPKRRLDLYERDTAPLIEWYQRARPARGGRRPGPDRRRHRAARPRPSTGAASS